MISGANHPEFPRDSCVARRVKLGSELMGANPYSVRRARPFWSTTTLAYEYQVSTVETK